VYAWIWRRLPFGMPGKLAGSVLITTAVAALLWYVVFPWAEPLLPFTGSDVQVTQDDGDPAGPAGGDQTGGDSVEGDPGLGDHDLPYATTTNNPPPTAR
jgi:hypothetical protein